MFQIDPMSRTPIYEQIVSQLERFIMTGALLPGDQIPSVRSVSLELSINPITTLKAYSELDSKGLIHSVPGRGDFVSDGASDALAADRAKLLSKMEEMAYELAMAKIPKDLTIEYIEAAYKKAEQTVGTGGNAGENSNGEDDDKTKRKDLNND